MRGVADILPLVDLVQCQSIDWVTTLVTVGCNNTQRESLILLANTLWAGCIRDVVTELAC